MMLKPISLSKAWKLADIDFGPTIHKKTKQQVSTNFYDAVCLEIIDVLNLFKDRSQKIFEAYTHAKKLENDHNYARAFIQQCDNLAELYNALLDDLNSGDGLDKYGMKAAKLFKQDIQDCINRSLDIKKFKHRTLL